MGHQDQFRPASLNVCYRLGKATFARALAMTRLRRKRPLAKER
jgi:hypothetical protein